MTLLYRALEHAIAIGSIITRRDGMMPV